MLLLVIISRVRLETTSLLSELGAKCVVSRAARDVHAKFLLKNGADEVIYPEKQMAEWAAIRYSADHIWIMWNLMMNMLFLKFLFRKTGWEELSDSLISAISITSILWHLSTGES